MYEKGFLLTNDKIRNLPILDTWLVEDFFISKKKTFKLFYDPSNECNVYSSDGLRIVLIGHCMDALECSKNIFDIVKSLHDLYSVSETNMLQYLYQLNGRFVLFVNTNSDITIYGDATGMKSIYYSTSSYIVSSHYNLINDVKQHSISSFYNHYLELDSKPWILPGDSTPFDNIYMLLANHKFSVISKSVDRYWPDRYMKHTSVEEVIDICSEIIKNEMEELVQRYDVIMSITSGNDSRVSLSASRSVKDKIKYFTYRNDNFDNVSAPYWEKDRYYNCQFSKKLCQKENMQFYELILNGADDRDFVDLKKNHYHFSIPECLPQYRLISSSNTMHVRSNIIEVVREKHMYSTIKADVIETICEWEGYGKQSPLHDEAYAINADYFRRNQLDQIYNYDLGDIFYIEYRMSQWLGGAILVENDLVFDTFLLFNCKLLIDYGMSLPRLLKEKNVLTTGIVNKLWPDIYSYGFPNDLLKIIDHYEPPINYMYNFDPSIYTEKKWYCASGSVSGNNVDVWLKASGNSLSFGFSNNVVLQGDYCEVVLPVEVYQDKCYYFEFDVLTEWCDYARQNGISYYVKINDDIIFSLDTQFFCNKTNQIVYYYKSKKTGTCLISVGLICNSNQPVKDFNGAINIKSVIIQSLSFSIKSNALISTWDKHKELRS